jgi:transcriptional regulator with XRE-family HTH domain
VDEARRTCRDLGQRIIELRKKRSLTQEQLAEQLLVDARELRRIESGENTTVHTLVKIAQALHVKIGELFELPSMRTIREPGRPAKAPKRRT